MKLTDKIGAIMNEYEVPLLRYATAILKDREQAKDTVQETFIRLLREFQQGKDVQYLQSWLYRVTHNLALDHIRKFKRRTDCMDAVLPTVVDEKQLTPDQQLSQTERYDLISTSLQELSEREQRLIIMKIYQQLSYKEIAEIMNLSVTNVGFILHQSMKKLADIYKANERLDGVS